MNYKLNVLSIAGEKIGEFNVSSEHLLSHVHTQAVFDSVLLERASLRQGTHSTKTKAEVSGTGKKPFKQKHTGNARQGSRRNPQFVGGGIAFGPKPGRNYSKKMNKKTHALAFASALSHLFHSQHITVLEDKAFVEEAPSAKVVFDFLKAANLIEKKLLLVVNENNPNLILSSRNFKRIIVKLANQVSVYDLINNQHVLIQQDSLDRILKVGA